MPAKEVIKRGVSTQIAPVRRLDNQLVLLKDSFRTEVLDMTALRNIPASQILRSNDADPALLKAFRDLCILTKVAMTQMNISCKGLPPDSVEKTWELVTQEGAKVVVLKGKLPGQRSKEDQMLGYGIVMLGRENIIDKYHIPEVLLEKENACRVIRLFATNEAREYMPRGEAFTKIIDRIKLLSAEGLLIGMILTDVKSRNGEKLDPSVWLDAKLALDARRFSSTGYAVTEEIGDRLINFEWWTWSKNSQATDSEIRLAQKVADLEQYKVQRLAPLVPSIPLTSATIAVHGRPNHSFDISRTYPGNLVISPNYQRSFKPESAHNLIRVAVDSGATYIEPGRLDASIIMGALPDIVSIAAQKKPQEAFREFVRKQSEQLADGGSLVIRDTVAAEQDKLIQIRLAPKEAQLWQDFIKARAENHISAACWNSIQEISDPADSKQRWIAPLSVANEFRCKFSYINKEQLNRPYTALKASEIRAILESEDFRINYDSAVENNLYKKRILRDRIEFLDLNGHKLDFEPVQHLFIAEKISADGITGVVLTKDESKSAPSFQSVKRYEKRGSDGNLQAVSELVVRQKKSNPERLATLDVLPFFIRQEHEIKRLYFTGRIVPRPLIALNNGSALDGSNSNIFHLEQIGAIFSRNQISNPAILGKKSKELLSERAHIKSSELKAHLPVVTGYTRADALDEVVFMQAIETQESYREDVVDNPIYNLTARPKIKTFEAGRYLQSCQAGISQDRRMELMVYQAGLRSGAHLGSWLGESLPLIEQAGFETQNLNKLLLLKSDVRFTESNMQFPLQFFDQREAHFVETSKDGNSDGYAKLEYAQPHPQQKLSNNSISVMPVCKKAGEIYVGLELREFAAAYLESGNAYLLTLPTLRIPQNIDSFSAAESWTIRRLKKFFAVSTNSLHKLGGKYLSSPGGTPDMIQPTICEVKMEQSKDNNLQWVSLSQLLQKADKLQCLQLRSAVYRAAHMYGLICQ